MVANTMALVSTAAGRDQAPQASTLLVSSVKPPLQAVNGGETGQKNTKHKGTVELYIQGSNLSKSSTLCLNFSLSIC